jgi:hypothetical protein
MASGRVRAKRRLLFAAEHGVLFTAYIRINLIAPYQILGMA